MQEPNIPTPPRSERVFVVRVWSEYDAATATVHLRGSVQSGPGAARRYFADWQELVEYMEAKAEQR